MWLPNVLVHSFSVVLILIASSSTALAQSSPAPHWAIAIHGGAGGDPTKWSDRQKELRRQGLERALTAGKEILAAGGTSLDAVEQTVRILEDDPTFNAGRGAVLTSDKRAELDAAIMDGSNKACGAVASVTAVANPISLARKIMTQTRHVLLVGPGADRYSAEIGMPQVDPSYFVLRPNEADQSLYRTSEGAYLGTVGCVALDAHGNLAAATSTGGLGGKMPGRVGDSPLIGAGTYAENSTCALSATGVGEEFIRNAVAFDVAAKMKYAGMSLENAVDQVIFQTLKPDTGGVISVAADGSTVLKHNTPGMSCGVADSRGRFDIMLAIENK